VYHISEDKWHWTFTQKKLMGNGKNGLCPEKNELFIIGQEIEEMSFIVKYVCSLFAFTWCCLIFNWSLSILYLFNFVNVRIVTFEWPHSLRSHPSKTFNYYIISIARLIVIWHHDEEISSDIDTCKFVHTCTNTLKTQYMVIAIL
jgi:hypothetical protein